MNPLERFKKICSFELKEDVYFYGVLPWNETLERWVKEGMPVKNLDNLKETNMHLLGNMDKIEWLQINSAIFGAGKCGNPPWIVSLDPLYEEEVLNNTSTHIIKRELDGTIVEISKNNKPGQQSIPRYLEYPVKDKKSWESFKKRLDPFSKGRWPDKWYEMNNDKMQYPLPGKFNGKHYKYRDFPIGMTLMSLYGNIRNYMGVENLSIAFYDNPCLIEDMLDWQTYMAYETIKKVLKEEVVPNIVWIWEDMCFNKGSLVSPDFVKTKMLPRYKKVTETLRENGVDAILVDCDGNIEELIPIWLEAGINTMWPLECAAGMDARNLRKKYGNEIILWGNVDKRRLAGTKSDIDLEVEKVKELIKYGGYIVSADHFIPPDVPYANVVYWINETRKLSKYPETIRLIP